jgi:hypothetical protein
MLVTGLIASWIVVVYFLVHTSKTENPTFEAPKKSIRVDASELTPAFLQRVQPAEEPSSLSKNAASAILESMKIFSKRKPDSFGLFVTAEPSAPLMTDKDDLILESEIIRKSDQETVAPDESSGQEGEVLESEPPEPAAPPAVEQPAPVVEPIKS